MKQFQDWVQWELSEDQIDLLQEGNVIAGEDCVYYLGTGVYYKHIRDTNTIFVTFNPAVLPAYVIDAIEEMMVWTLDRINGTETTILYPVKGTRRTDNFFDDNNNEYWYCEQLEGPRTMKILVDTTPDIDVSISGGCPKSWIKVKGRFLFPDGQIIDFK